jgi:hypothetical protein
MGHPAGIAAKGVWFGTEIEGYHFGEPAVFLARKPTLVESAAMMHRNFDVVFLTEDFEDWDWLKTSSLLEAVDMGEVTISCGRYTKQLDAFFALPKEITERVELLVRVFDSPWIKLLRPNDQVSVGVPYDMSTFAVHDAVVTVPEDYKGDEEV